MKIVTIQRIFWFFFALCFTRACLCSFHKVVSDKGQTFYTANKKYEVLLLNDDRKVYIKWENEKATGVQVCFDVSCTASYVFLHDKNNYIGFLLSNRELLLYSTEKNTLVEAHIESKGIIDIEFTEAFFIVKYADGWCDMVDLLNGEKYCSIKVKDPSYKDISFSDDFTLSYVLYNDNTIQVFQLPKGCLIPFFQSEAQSITKIGFIKNKVLFVLYPRKLVLYCKRAKKVYESTVNVQIKDFILSKDGNLVMLCLENGLACLYGFDGSFVCKVKLRDGAVQGVYFFPKYSLVFIIYEDNCMEIFHTGIGTRFTKLQLYDEEIEKITLQRKGLLLRYVDGFAQLYTSSKWEYIATMKLKKNKNIIMASKVSGTSIYVYVLYDDYELEVFECQEKYKCFTLSLMGDKIVKRVLFPQGSQKKILRIAYYDDTYDDFHFKKRSYLDDEDLDDSDDEIDQYLKDDEDSSSEEESGEEEDLRCNEEEMKNITGKKRKREDDEGGKPSKKRKLN